MTDYASFKYGAVSFPLGSADSLLKTADPALFYLLEFYASILTTHIGTRLIAEAAAADASEITSAVRETVPLDPAPFLQEEHFKFPLLSIARKRGKPEWTGRSKHSVDEVEVQYILPPLLPGQAERLLPILRAVYALFDNRTEMGFDPAYTPTGGAAGDPFWPLAGIASVGVVGCSYGGYPASDRLFFPAVTLTLELKERSDFALDEFEDFDRVDADIDLAHPTDPTLEDVVQIQVYPGAILTEGSETILSESGDALKPEDE